MKATEENVNDEELKEEHQPVLPKSTKNVFEWTVRRYVARSGNGFTRSGHQEHTTFETLVSNNASYPCR